MLNTGKLCTFFIYNSVSLKLRRLSLARNPSPDWLPRQGHSKGARLGIHRQAARRRRSRPPDGSCEEVPDHQRLRLRVCARAHLHTIAHASG